MVLHSVENVQDKICYKPHKIFVSDIAQLDMYISPEYSKETTRNEDDAKYPYLSDPCARQLLINAQLCNEEMCSWNKEPVHQRMWNYAMSYFISWKCFYLSLIDFYAACIVCCRYYLNRYFYCAFRKYLTVNNWFVFTCLKTYLL